MKLINNNESKNSYAWQVIFFMSDFIKLYYY